MWQDEFDASYAVPDEIMALVRDNLLDDISDKSGECPVFEHYDCLLSEDGDPPEETIILVWCEHPDESKRRRKQYDRFHVQMVCGAHDLIDLHADDAKEVADMVRYLVKPTWQQMVAMMKAEIEDMVRHGTLPASVNSFSELHDHIDANCIAYTEALWQLHNRDEMIAMFNEASGIVDEWIKQGGVKAAAPLTPSELGEVKRSLSDLGIE